MLCVLQDSRTHKSEHSPMKSEARTLFWGYLLLLVVMFVLIGYVHYLLDPALRPLIIKEGGVIETASAVAYLLAASAVWGLGGWQAVKQHWSLVLLLLAFASRELDFDKRFTSEKIFNLRMYTGDEAALWEQLLGAAIIALLLFALVTTYKRYGAEFKQGIRQLQFIPVSIAIGLVLMVLSKTLDGLARKLAGVGILISDEANSLASDIEEIFELAVSLIFLCCVIKGFRSRRSRSGYEIH